MFCAALIAVTTYSSVAATDPPASATQAGFDLLWWVTTASLVLSPIILIGLATQGAWKLPPSPRLPAWRMPLEVGFLVFATSILLGGIGNWLAAGFSNGDGAEFDSLRTIGMGTLGAYIGSSIPLVAMGILWTQLPRPVGSEAPLPRAAAIIFGAIALAIGLPLVLAVSSLGNHFQQMIQGTEAVSIAHDTLKLLITTPKNLWWWIVALGALLAAPIVEETLLPRNSPTVPASARGRALVGDSAYHRPLCPHARPRPEQRSHDWEPHRALCRRLPLWLDSGADRQT